MYRYYGILTRIEARSFCYKKYFRIAQYQPFLFMKISGYCSHTPCFAFIHTRVREKYLKNPGFTKPLHKTFASLSRVSVESSNVSPTYIVMRGLKKKSSEDLSHENDSLSHLFQPVTYQDHEFEERVGEDIVGPLKKDDIMSLISRFYTDDEIKLLAAEQGLDKYLFQKTIISFRKFCMESKKLPTDLHIVINDILKGASHIHDLYPYFYSHAKQIFPHLTCMEDLYKVSDLTQPPNWFPEARSMSRKIIFHAGPTNSGKTYHAMEQFLSAESGIYCAPLKLLAVEVAAKSNDRGTPCDLITGEERRFAVSDEFPSTHLACTVEMTSVNTKYEVAIVDEIQMIKDPLRGWAWTRAILGLNAKELHVCGEPSAIQLVKELAMSVGEDVEVRRYKRLTSLNVEETALGSFDLVRPGDCIVCFSRQQIHRVAQIIESQGHEVAVIYGGLPPGAKLAQAKKFNDSSHPCKIMVATDAVGMGLNLSIRRVIFNSLVKPHVNDAGEKEMETISSSTALQISGRAGRYGTKYEEGYVTTLKSTDLPVLRKLLSMTPPDIEQAGLNPTSDQIELFAYHLPTYSLSNLIDIFSKLCTMDRSLYFMCLLEDFKFLADRIQHVSLPLRVRYIFCCAPINKDMQFVCAIFLKFARLYSHNEPATLQWLCTQLKLPFNIPKNISELVMLEEIFDVFDLYLWLGYRFPDMFPHMEMVRNLQLELDDIIQLGVSHITKLLKNSEHGSLPPAVDADVSSSHFRFQASRREEDLKGLASSLVPKHKETPRELGLTISSRKRGKRSLSDRLIKAGILSRNVLQELKAEWRNEEKSKR